jgi:hypothetical protein
MFVIKSYSKSQLAGLYNCCVRTFVKDTKQIVDIGRKQRYYPNQVQQIIEHLGPPTILN